MVTTYPHSVRSDRHATASDAGPDRDPTSSVLARLERRVRHLEATTDYLQGLERRSEELEREVQALHDRVDLLEHLQSKTRTLA